MTPHENSFTNNEPGKPPTWYWVVSGLAVLWMLFGYTFLAMHAVEVLGAAGRHYALFVGLPANYSSEPNKRYPVVYVTDGYWDFQKITAIHGALVYDKYAPEFITVGMGYAWVLLVNATVRNEAVISRVAETGLTENAFLMFFFAGFALVVALAFAWYARRYPMQDNYRTAGK